MAAIVHIAGIEELKHALDHMVDTMHIATSAGLTDAAHLIEAQAKEAAPVETGTLRRSIRVDGPKPVGVTRQQVHIGPTVVYSRRIELGFKGADSLGRHYNQEGQPYMQPAFDAVVARLPEI